MSFQVRSILAAASVVATTGALWLDVPRAAAMTRSTTIPSRGRLPFHRCSPPIAMEEEWTPSDDSLLAEHIRIQRTSARCGRPDYVLSGLNQAWVLIFNVGQQDEGVYTLQGQQAPVSAYVLAFEYMDDADRFAQLLQAEAFDLATPSCWDISQLSALCDAGEFEVSLVPQGALITPPAKNEYDVDAFDRVQDGIDGVDPDAYATQRAAFERLYSEGTPPEGDMGV